MTRLDSSLEAAGAEFLVLGHLLIEGIQAMKAYTNFPGYDIVATSPDERTSCRIQVKSRWATNYNRGFPIRSFKSDFVVFVELNRGFRGGRRNAAMDEGRRPPRFFVFPIGVVEAARRDESRLGIVRLRDIPDAERYVDDWGAVRAFLKHDPESPLNHVD